MSTAVIKNPKLSGIITSAFGAIVLALSACSDDAQNHELAPEPEPAVSDTIFNRVITVLNFGESLPGGHEPLDEMGAVYYSLEQNRTIPESYKKTALWDVSFSGVYRSFLGGNNGKNNQNFGAGGPGKGGVSVLKKAFDDVVDIPGDQEFKTGSAIIGTDDEGHYGQGTGYYLYDFNGLLIGDGSYEKQHVAYCLADTLTTAAGKKIGPRTIVIKTASGHYAKICMMSLYKNQLNPADWKRTSEAPFLSFKYMIVKAGSSRFEIK